MAESEEEIKNIHVYRVARRGGKNSYFEFHYGGSKPPTADGDGRFVAKVPIPEKFKNLIIEPEPRHLFSSTSLAFGSKSHLEVLNGVLKRYNKKNPQLCFVFDKYDLKKLQKGRVRKGKYVITYKDNRLNVYAYRTPCPAMRSLLGSTTYSVEGNTVDMQYYAPIKHLNVENGTHPEFEAFLQQLCTGYLIKQKKPPKRILASALAYSPQYAWWLSEKGLGLTRQQLTEGVPLAELHAKFCKLAGVNPT